MKTSAQTDNRFQSDAGKFAAYLESPEGRLRLNLSFANLQEFLPGREASNSLCALDLGGGTGAAAVRLARLGFHVTIVDSSPAMLAIAQRAALDAQLNDRIALKHGDVGDLGSLFPYDSYDLVLCHNVLEYVADAHGVLCAAARMMKTSSILSVLVRNQAGEALKAAIQAGDLAAANDGLTAEWGQESLYGGKVRLFNPENLRALLKTAGFQVIAERGVRVIVDYLPQHVSRSDEYERIFALERKVGCRAEFAGVARYIQFLARRV